MKVFITGGTTGIGFALAKDYLNDGHEVAICGRDLTKIPDNFEHANLSKYQVDVTDLESITQAVEDFSKGQLDIMIANAGRSVGSKTREPNFEAARSVININVIGVLNTFEAALKVMIPNNKGHLVGVASVAGFVGLPGAGPYSASKAAVLKLCESFSLDLKHFNIDVTAIAPGFIDTPLTRKNDHKMPFLMPASRGAMLIKNAIAAKKKLFVFPWQMKCVMYILEKMPRFLYRKFMGLKFADYSR